ncbi:hypothetical protein CLAFUW4_13234 [Fulvia fulva]|uniref:Uncharacterized protein n=1 Tax=Passalora fulva TaxID=5499 RepID=A0A9Q8PJ80_PASFU|nr:uncharacterized protein CLAFUR5_13090 [Fulvia fulva]KAK4611510.1 hypothetical protein CLAFUR4_13239 [Fulvia fulva]KAK4612394.1 hypothetical protein CLAFUR0_13244 [Fulvia fulva]UJO23389.1 hypothetical protein CLAFUR5_13090 [Fulvia fulva]WPV21109.1 hypothetical protein CLAFUW4_13234 [Fulvia fulva]WPV36188.1 hypothetical protein CLAFUW7_13241 [Fulvia fulva]
MRIHKVLMLELFFDRLEGPNDSRCVFKEDPKSTGGPSKGASETFRRTYEKKKGQQWRRALDEYMGIKHGRRTKIRQFERPAHIISIYGHSLDSVLPGLEYDIENRELSFQWEPMLAAFFSEQHELNRRSEGLESYSELADQFAAEQIQPYSGHLRFALMAVKLQKAAAAKEKVMLRVRRQRIMKQYREFYTEERIDKDYDVDAHDEAVHVGKVVAVDGAGTGRERTGSGMTNDASDEDSADDQDEQENDSEAEEDDDPDYASVSSGGDPIEGERADEYHDLSDID